MFWLNLVHVGERAPAYNPFLPYNISLSQVHIQISEDAVKNGILLLMYTFNFQQVITYKEMYITSISPPKVYIRISYVSTKGYKCLQWNLSVTTTSIIRFVTRE